MHSNNPTTSPSVIAGYFSNRSEAEKAINELRNAGFNANQLGIAARYSSFREERSSATDIEGKVRGTWDKIVDFFQEHMGVPERRTRETAAAGQEASTGSDQAVRPNQREAASYITNPGIEQRGEAEAITSRHPEYGSREYGDYEYNKGDYETSLNELHVPGDRSRYLSHNFDRGKEGVIVTVAAAGRESEVAEILERNGADLGHNAATYEYSTTDTDTAQRAEQPQRIQLLGEALRIHKQRVSRGDVRLRKQVVGETQTVQVPVTREELVIERAAGAGTPVDAEIGTQAEIRVPLSEERATVEKQPIVREEVSVGKRTVSDVQQFEERVQREELQVDEDLKNKKRSA
jgi:uncharacterized protein (TIGR02271 family)